MNRAKRPQLKNDNYSSLRRWMLSIWEQVQAMCNIRGDGRRVAVTRTPTGTVISIREDDYKKSFPFYCEAAEGTRFSELDLWDIAGGAVYTPDASFTLLNTQISEPEKYLLLAIYNSTASTAATMPSGDGETQQDIPANETGMYGKFETMATLPAEMIGEVIYIQLGYFSNNFFTQTRTGDFYMTAAGSNQQARVRAPGATYQYGAVMIGGVFVPFTVDDAVEFKYAVGGYTVDVPDDWEYTTSAIYQVGANKRYEGLYPAEVRVYCTSLYDSADGPEFTVTNEAKFENAKAIILGHAGAAASTASQEVTLNKPFQAVFNGSTGNYELQKPVI